MFRIAMIMAALALPALIADGAEARCVRGTAGCGVGAAYHGAGAGARGVGVTHGYVGNRNGGVNRLGPRR